MRTEMTLPVQDLHSCELHHAALRGGELPVTFSLREFKAIIFLLREIDHRMVLHIEGTGKPVIFTSETRSDVPCPPPHPTPSLDHTCTLHGPLHPPALLERDGARVPSHTLDNRVDE